MNQHRVIFNPLSRVSSTHRVLNWIPLWDIKKLSPWPFISGLHNSKPRRNVASFFRFRVAPSPRQLPARQSAPPAVQRARLPPGHQLIGFTPSDEPKLIGTFHGKGGGIRKWHLRPCWLLGRSERTESEDWISSQERITLIRRESSYWVRHGQGQIDSCGMDMREAQPAMRPTTMHWLR